MARHALRAGAPTGHARAPAPHSYCPHQQEGLNPSLERRAAQCLAHLHLWRIMRRHQIRSKWLLRRHAPRLERAWMTERLEAMWMVEREPARARRRRAPWLRCNGRLEMLPAQRRRTSFSGFHAMMSTSIL